MCECSRKDGELSVVCKWVITSNNWGLRLVYIYQKQGMGKVGFQTLIMELSKLEEFQNRVNFKSKLKIIITTLNRFVVPDMKPYYVGLLALYIISSLHPSEGSMGYTAGLNSMLAMLTDMDKTKDLIQPGAVGTVDRARRDPVAPPTPTKH